jgi:hypothetical protein
VNIAAAQDSGDGAAILPLYTIQTFEHYDSLLKIGLDGTADQVRRLEPFDRMEVLRMRVKAKRSELAHLTGRQYVEFATSRKWYAQTDPDADDGELQNLQFGIDCATAEIPIKELKTRVRFRFMKENGQWKYDEPTTFQEMDLVLRKLADSEGIAESELVIGILEDELQMEEIPDSAWQPMPKK